MLYIMTTPYVLQKLKDEIDAGIKEGKVSHQITTMEAKTLPYLQVPKSYAINIFTEAGANNDRRSYTRVSESTRPSLACFAKRCHRKATRMMASSFRVEHGSRIAHGQSCATSRSSAKTLKCSGLSDGSASMTRAAQRWRGLWILPLATGGGHVPARPCLSWSSTNSMSRYVIFLPVSRYCTIL